MDIFRREWESCSEGRYVKRDEAIRALGMFEGVRVRNKCEEGKRVEVERSMRYYNSSMCHDFKSH